MEKKYPGPLSQDCVLNVNCLTNLSSITFTFTSVRFTRISGGSSIFQTGDTNPKGGGANLLYYLVNFFSENCPSPHLPWIRQCLCFILGKYVSVVCFHKENLSESEKRGRVSWLYILVIFNNLCDFNVLSFVFCPRVSKCHI